MLRQGFVIVGSALLFGSLGCGHSSGTEHADKKACAKEGEKKRGDGRYNYVCRDGRWVEIPRPIPGFVGIGRAGQRRAGGASVRKKTTGPLPLLV